MIHMLVVIALLIVSAPCVVAQLARVGTSLSINERRYFGIPRNRVDVDSVLVINDIGVSLVGMRDDTVVYTVKFSPDEVPILNRYIRDYEQLLDGENDMFVGDKQLRKILDRVSPTQIYRQPVPLISVRLTDGSVRTGVPLAASDENLLLSSDSTFVPQMDLQARAFVCIPVAQIANVSRVVEDEPPSWFLIDGEIPKFRTAMRIMSEARVYKWYVPPEIESCISVLLDDSNDGAPRYSVCPRSNVWTLTVFGGAMALMTRSSATAVQSSRGLITDIDLSYQPVTYSTGIELSRFMSQLFDIGARLLVQAQPPTINDSSQQNSFGSDSYTLQILGTWHLVPIDSIGYNRIGLSTTIALGSSYVHYRARTFLAERNFTSFGPGVTFDASLNVSASIALSRSFVVGMRGFGMYQLGLYDSIASITHNVPFQSVRYSFSVGRSSFLMYGAHLFTSYSF